MLGEPEKRIFLYLWGYVKLYKMINEPEPLKKVMKKMSDKMINDDEAQRVILLEDIWQQVSQWIINEIDRQQYLRMENKRQEG